MPGTERDWTIEETDDRESPDWASGQPVVFQNEDPALADGLEDVMMILHRLGGIVTVAAVREEVGPNRFQTVGYAFKWDSYGGPAKRAEREQPRQEPQRRQGRNGGRGVPENRPQPAEPTPPEVEDDDVEPDGGTVVDEQRPLSEADVDPDNADIADDHRNAPGDVFAGNA